MKRDKVKENEALNMFDIGLQKLDKMEPGFTFYKNQGMMAWWNDSKARDQAAKQENTYFHGRFGIDKG